MTIWSKINPFHARPSSALSSAPPPPRSSGLDDRPWSAMDHPDSVHELLYDREETLRTPVPLRSLESRHTTPRKGGISHSLKHHPSLAVLRGRFKRNNEDDTRGSFSASGWRAESPAMIKDRSGSRATERSATTEGRSSRASRGAIGGPSPGKRLIRKLSLRRMKSVPRELNGVSVHGASTFPDCDWPRLSRGSCQSKWAYGATQVTHPRSRTNTRRSLCFLPVLPADRP